MKNCQGIQRFGISDSLLLFEVDGQWGGWSSWSACSTTCDWGTATQTRSCDSPSPAYGGLNCNGFAEQSSSCFVTNCPGTIAILHQLQKWLLKVLSFIILQTFTYIYTHMEGIL